MVASSSSNKIVKSHPSSWPEAPSTWAEGDKQIPTSDGKTLLIEQGGRTFRQSPGVNEYSPHSDDMIGPEPGGAQVRAKSSIAGDKGTKAANPRKFSAERTAMGKEA